ncbi:GPR1/FUN34/yaaH family-domain-containing protein [Protomyces lactucae-debilis]|uniref:GPR1/FUN34/yaaH family-domain-containing protein n=1 Tax=Protomyces lactucae-debilis TaxID=2754530 RepID=A0A1Y2EZH5_PROLT|nr:GPR1/FUN34/yaaH family-domain-containing protein [Protomyces lactucae-debilis]ORY77008.1 GPR1/FUN34/yaaH family-domain-containing protein [Protomyces lactucae-debilis]
MFERLYLNPKNDTENTLRKLWGNPTPIALAGFLMALTPLSCVLMGWGGATSTVVLVPTFTWLGGLIMVVSGLLEFFLGNTFAALSFSTFGGFYLSFGTLLNPDNGIAAAYANSASATETFNNGGSTTGYLSGLALYCLWWGVLDFLYFIVSLRTNVTFALVFITIDIDLFLLAASYWQTTLGHTDLAQRLQVAAGAFGFLCSMTGFYLEASILFDTLDFPITLPLGDLSGWIKPKSVRQKAKESLA